MRNRIVAVGLLASALTACGSSSKVSEVTGKLQGAAFPEVRSAVSAEVIDSYASMPPSDSALILLTSSENLCQDLNLGQNPRGDHQMAIRVYAEVGDNQTYRPLEAGLYTIDPSQPAQVGDFRAEVSVESTDQSCAPEADTMLDGRSGSVALKEIRQDNTYRGTFDVVLSNGDHLTGEFDTESCYGTALQRKAENSDKLICK